MVSIKCPICDQVVEAKYAMDLSNGFRDHLVDSHQLTTLSCATLDAIEAPRETTTYRVEREVTVEGPPGTTTSEEARRLVREGSTMTEKSPLRGEVIGEEGYREGSMEVSEPDVERRSVERKGLDFMIQCPFCSKVIEGDDEDDLGDNLKDHWGDSHQLRPTIRASMGMDRGR